MLLLLGTAAETLQAGETLPEPDPVAYREGLLKNGNLHKGTGEGFCWHASYGSGNFLSAYEAFGTTHWLDEAIKYYDFWCGKLSKDPDGYEGWIGNTINNAPEVKADALVGDAVLCQHLVRFAEIVKADPKLKEKYGAKAQAYQDRATKIIWEKWNHRGCFYEDAAGWGSYHTHDKAISIKTGKWVKSGIISDNLNKHYSAGLVIAVLWRLTGKPEYKERVKKIYGRAKTMWLHYPEEKRIVWNFWMPHGPYDIEGTAPKSWVSVHPSRAGYQSGEVGDFVEVYDSGLVFDQADLEMMIRTNLWMHNGGKWRSADGSTKAGTLWGALARFDDTIRGRIEASVKGKKDAKSQIAYAYLKNVTEKHLGWKRLHVKDESKIEVVNVPLQPGHNLTMTQIIPNWVETANEDRVKFVTKTRIKGTLKIELLDKAGEVLGTLHEINSEEKNGEYMAPLWDGTNPKTGKKDVGEYQVRWTLNNESRSMPVWVKVGTKKEKTGPDVLKPGETIVEDFEGERHVRWKGNALSSAAQAHSGKKSLELKRGKNASLVLGEYDNLPVKISMWVFDTGKKLGKSTANGPGWGVKNAKGDQFAVRPTWRKYLGGDTDYCWFNTGENQWFTPHATKTGRKAGWSEWVFDFTNKDKPAVTVDGKALGTLVDKYTPNGAIALMLFGGDDKSGAWYIDDVKVEYPKE